MSDQYSLVMAPECPIYHYGACKSAKLINAKYKHYAELEGKPYEDTTVFWGKLDLYLGKHPLIDYNVGDFIK